MTHPSIRKRRERDATKLFGAKRRRCSGSPGREEWSGSDSMHAILFLETELRRHHAVVAPLDATRALARKGGRVPVVALATKGPPGIVLVLAAEDLTSVAAEFAKTLAKTPLP